MGRDTANSSNPKNPEWDYPHPDSVIEYVQKKSVVGEF